MIVTKQQVWTPGLRRAPVSLGQSNYIVKVGSPGHFDDQADDQIRDLPAMEKMS